MAFFIGSNIYRGSSYGRLHPLSILRVPTVIDLARSLGWLPQSVYRTSPRAKPAALEMFHTPDYVAALLRAEASQSVSPEVTARHGLGTLSNPVFPEMFRRPATAAGGGLLAAELVAGGGVVFNPGGGTHHGMADRAAGFCYLNEPVLTIRRLLALGLDRVAYVDIDAHHGDGVEVGFAGDPRVRLVSVHEAGRWPFTGTLADDAGGNAFNFAVPRGFHDDEFALVLNEVILPVVDHFAPQAIFLQCGADAVTEDPLSRLCLSNRSHVLAVRALQPLAPRLIVSGGGGYNPWTVARLWTAVWATLAGYDVPDRLPPRACSVLTGLDWLRKGRPTRAHLTTLIDGARGGALRPEIRAGADHLRQRIKAEI